MSVSGPSNRDTDVENKHMDTKKGKRVGMSWETEIDIYIYIYTHTIDTLYTIDN